MTISPVQAYAAHPVQAAPQPKAVEEITQPAAKKDTAFISEKAKDLAAQASGKTEQEETKESPAVEQREEADIQPKQKSIAEG
ncbi:MAG: hypothetical protein NTV54_06330 [Ignavibacteriales bacterium]|nr:hypothetical protein [Ignavibacteriales bacterium]